MTSHAHPIWAALVVVVGCTKQAPLLEPVSETESQAPAAVPRTSLSSPRTQVAPQPSRQQEQPSSASSEGSLSELPVPGFLPAVVYQPAGSEPRPLVVATHGAGGVPEGDCVYWARLTEGRVFVLCLRGTPFDRAALSSFYYKNHLELGRELEAALEAARAAYGARLAPGAGLYSGFSQGATMGVGMIPRYGAELPHLVLIEGGYDYWSVAQAKKYRANGGRRVLFVCGTKWCADKSEKAATWLRQAGLEARVEYAPGVGHTPLGAVMERVAAGLPWVVSSDPAWQLE